MIDKIDQRLKTWVDGVLKSVNVSFDPPGPAQTKEGIGIYLMELAHTLQSRKGKRPPLQISLRYLVTAWSENQEDAHRMLGELVFAAMENSEFELALDPVPADLWNAFSIPPRPSFTLRVPCILERPERKVPLVREPLVVNFSPVSRLSGLVLGPHDRPLTGAEVELPGLRLSTRTDAKGRFTFSSVPQELSTKHLLVRANGRDFNIDTKKLSGNNRPIIINIQEMEV